MSAPTRRAALGMLASAASGAAGAFGCPQPALAQVTGPGQPSAGLRVRAIAVDTTAMARRGDQTGADLVARSLSRQMRAVFGDLVAPAAAGGSTLVARIASLYLASYVGNRAYGGRDSGGGGNDSLEGVGIVMAGGRAITETPILAVLDPGYSGAWYLPGLEERRIASISYQFAWWLRREMGL